MPWQRHVWDVALEVDPDTGHLWYRDVWGALPRQSGKTTLLLPKWVWRAEAAHLLGGRQRMLYTAQTGKDANEKFDEDFVEDLAASPVMRPRHRAINHQGRKAIRFQSGSRLIPMSPLNPAAGHGKTVDDGSLDEAFAQPDNRVEGAWRPAMVTRQDAQFWAVSTAGKSRTASAYWWAKVLAGRRLTQLADPNSRVAYFEWGAPAGADPRDPAVWRAHHPALGLTQTEAVLAHELQTLEAQEQNPGEGLLEFARAYLNMWSDDFDADDEWVIPRQSWGECLDVESRRAAGSLPALSLDVTPDRGAASVAFTALRDDGLPMSQVVRHDSGTGWVAEYVGRMVREKGACVVVMDSVGPAKSLLPAVETAVEGRCPVELMTTGDVADACAQLYDAVVTQQWRHTGQAPLDDAVAAAAWRMLPGGRKAWDRRGKADISPLVAVTNSGWGLSRFGGFGVQVF